MLSYNSMMNAVTPTYVLAAAANHHHQQQQQQHHSMSQGFKRTTHQSSGSRLNNRTTPQNHTAYPTNLPTTSSGSGGGNRGGGGGSSGNSSNNNNNNSTGNTGGNNRGPPPGATPMEQEIYRLEMENAELRTKLETKCLDIGRLRIRAKDAKIQADQYRKMVQDLKQALSGKDSRTVKSVLEHAVRLMSTEKKSQKITRARVQAKRAQHSRHGCAQCCDEAERKYACDWIGCGKRFRQKAHLDAHRNIHTGERFVCDWPNCNKSFLRKFNLQEHKRTHNGINPYVCTYPECGKVFSTKYSLTRHQQSRHSLEAITANLLG